MAFGEDDPEALGRRPQRPDSCYCHVALGLERHHDDVVDRRKRPQQQESAEQRGSGIAKIAPAPGSAPHPLGGPGRGGCSGGDRHPGPGVSGYRAELCASEVFSLRIRMMTSGISNGSADMTAATPSCGLPSSSMSRTTPSVAKRCVELAG